MGNPSNWLDTGYAFIAVAGVVLTTQRTVINLPPGSTATDNPTTGQTDITIGGTGSGISALTGDVTASGSGSVAATVRALQGVPVTTNAPVTGNVLTYNGTSWTPATPSVSTAVASTGLWYTSGTNLHPQGVALTGDVSQGALSGNNLPIQVTGINGATVPAAGGALVTGNSLYVSGGGALSYEPLNLAGGAGWVSGVLPAANMANLAGDASGAVSSTTVTKAQGGAVTFGANAAALYLATLVSLGTAEVFLGTGTVSVPTLSATAGGATVSLYGGTTLQLGLGNPVMTLVATSTTFAAGTNVLLNGANGAVGGGALLVNESSGVPAPGGSQIALFATGSPFSGLAGGLGIIDATGTGAVWTGSGLYFGTSNTSGASDVTITNQAVTHALTVSGSGGVGGVGSSSIPGTVSVVTQSALAAVSGTSAGAHGGDFAHTLGNGAAGLGGNSAGGRGGQSIRTFGNGGNSVGTGVPGAGGGETVTCGNGGTAFSTGNNANGGSYTVNTGAPGTGGSGSAGNPGSFNVNIGGSASFSVSPVGDVTCFGAHFSALGAGVLALNKATTNPSSNSQTNGGVIYSDSVTGNLSFATVSFAPSFIFGTLASGKGIFGIPDTGTAPITNGATMGLMWSAAGVWNWCDETSTSVSLSGSTLTFGAVLGAGSNGLITAGASTGGASSSVAGASISVTTPAGAAATLGTAGGLHGGDSVWTLGNGANGLGGTSGGGRGGNYTGNNGNGGNSVSTGTPGAGGAYLWNTGNGGTAFSTGNNANGGNYTVSTGAPGTGGSGTAGLAGAFQVQIGGSTNTFGIGINGGGMYLAPVSVAKVTPTLTLTAAQYGNPRIKLTGTLTANMVVALPNISSVWWFDLSALLGAFTVSWTCGSSGASGAVACPVSSTSQIVMVTTDGGNATPSVNA